MAELPQIVPYYKYSDSCTSSTAFLLCPVCGTELSKVEGLHALLTGVLKLWFSCREGHASELTYTMGASEMIFRVPHD